VTISDAEPSNSIELAAEIVAAFVANNSLPTVELPALIHSVHAALARLASGQVNTAPLVEKQEPAVSVRKSLTPISLCVWTTARNSSRYDDTCGHSA